LDYSSKLDGTTCMVSFRGKFSFSDNEMMQKVIEDIKGSDCSLCSIDLSGLESIDSAGLGMLLLVNDAIQEDDKSMEISGPTGQVQKMLEISKFSEIIPVKA